VRRGMQHRRWPKGVSWNPPKLRDNDFSEPTCNRLNGSRETLFHVFAHPFDDSILSARRQPVVVPRLVDLEMIFGAVERKDFPGVHERGMHILKTRAAVKQRINHVNWPRSDAGQDLVVVVRDFVFISDEESQTRYQRALERMSRDPAHARAGRVAAHR